MDKIKTRLSILNFLEFAVWGSYLVSLGMFLDANGLGAHTFWFYTVQGLVSLFMPAVVGIVADRWLPAQKMLSLCHLIAGAFMIAAGWYAMTTAKMEFAPFFTLYTISVAFYMPTIGLNNSVAFNALTKAGEDTVKAFPPIRVWGTVGFIFAELLINFVSVGGDSIIEFGIGQTTIQHTYHQLFLCGIFSLIITFYALTMPKCPVNHNSSSSLAESLGLTAFKLFKRKEMALFFIFSMLLGVSLQITNSYGTTFINQFAEVPQYMNDLFAKNPTFLISFSQASEALCILLIPYFLKRYGIKGVMLISMFAWVLRFGFFGIGNTGFPGVAFLFLSCLVYGVAFDFFNVSGGLFVDQQTSPKLRSSAQGLFMIMTNGIGASLGTFIAGTYIVTPRVYADGLDATQKLAGWHESWLIFAAYALVVGILFYFIFKEPKALSQKELEDAEV